jgi:hypothetical protein
MVALHAEAEGKWERRWGPTRRADEEEEEGGGLNTPWHVGEREARPATRPGRGGCGRHAAREQGKGGPALVGHGGVDCAGTAAMGPSR